MPYQRQQEEWKQEGQYVDDAARLSDSHRSRQIAGILAQIKQQEAADTHRETQDYRRELHKDRLDAAKSAHEDRVITRNESRADRRETRADRLEAAKDRKSARKEARADRLEARGEKLTPFDKAGLDKYGDLTKDRGDPAKIKEYAVEKDPNLRSLFEDRSDKKAYPTLDERSKLIPRANLNSDEISQFQRVTTDNRLLDSLGFGDTPYPEVNPQMINPLTGRPYTPEELKSLGRTPNYGGEDFLPRGGMSNVK